MMQSMYRATQHNEIYGFRLHAMMTYTQNETDKAAPAVGQSTGVDLSKAALEAKSALGAVGARRVTIQKPLMKIQQTHRVADGEKITDSLTLPPYNRVGGLSSPSHTTARAIYGIRRFPISV